MLTLHFSLMTHCEVEIENGKFDLSADGEIIACVFKMDDLRFVRVRARVHVWGYMSVRHGFHHTKVCDCVHACDVCVYVCVCTFVHIVSGCVSVCMHAVDGCGCACSVCVTVCVHLIWGVRENIGPHYAQAPGPMFICTFQTYNIYLKSPGACDTMASCAR